MTASCPICGWPGGFHDTDDKTGEHASREVPRELLLEPGWVKEAHAELKREQAEHQARIIAEAEQAEGAGEADLDLPLPSPGGGV